MFESRTRVREYEVFLDDNVKHKFPGRVIEEMCADDGDFPNLLLDLEYVVPRPGLWECVEL
jgi:hypothetical protein